MGHYTSTNIINAVIDVTQAAQAVRATNGIFDFPRPSGTVYLIDSNHYWTDYRPKGKTLAGKVHYGDEDYPFQGPVVSQDYSDKTLIGG